MLDLLHGDEPSADAGIQHLLIVGHQPQARVVGHLLWGIPGKNEN